MPFRAGTLAERRTQLDLRCDRCRYEWSIEISPPVLIVTPNREADIESSATGTIPNEGGINDRRKSNAVNRQRMRAGLRGLLTSTDRTHTITVLYSLNAERTTGRLRLIDRTSAWPVWLVPGSRLWLSDYDGVPLRIRITVAKPRSEGRNDDDVFAEFVVPPLTH